MRFLASHRLTEAQRARTVGCDGLCGTGLDLSHWPGNRTPPEFKADLSTEIALRFAASDEWHKWEACTNNHYDADGVLSLFACVEPEFARAHRGILVAAAAFGDFGEGTQEEALKLAATLDGLRSHPQSPLAPKLRSLDDADADAFATEHVLAALPDLCTGGVATHEALWREPLAGFQATRDALDACELAVTNLASARLTIAEWTREPHPAVVQGAGEGDLLLFIVQGEAGYRYRAEWRGYSWADTVSAQRPPLAKLDLEKLCLPLNSVESANEGRWLTEGYPQGMTEALRFTDERGRALESRLAPSEVVPKLAWFLQDRRKAGA